MAATRLLAFRWIVAAVTAAAVSVAVQGTARATENADDPISIRDGAVADSMTTALPDGATQVRRSDTKAVTASTGDALSGPVVDRGKALGAQPEKVISEYTGIASWYGPGFHGRRTASGDRFDQNDLTAAHKTLPFNTRVRVTSVVTGRSVIVTINDRGPYVRGRMIDLSAAAARAIGMRGRGVGKVRLEVLETPLDVIPAAGSRATANREGPALPRSVTSEAAAE